MQVKAYIESTSLNNTSLIELVNICLPYATSSNTPIKITGKELSTCMKVSLRTVRNRIKKYMKTLTEEVVITSVKGRNGYYLINFNNKYVKVYETTAEPLISSPAIQPETKVVNESKDTHMKRKHTSTGNPVGRPKQEEVNLEQPPSQLQQEINSLAKKHKPLDRIKLQNLTHASLGQYHIWRPKEIYMPDLKKENALSVTAQKKVERARNDRLNKEIKSVGLHWKHFQESSAPESNLEAYLLMCAYSVYKNITEYRIDVKAVNLEIERLDLQPESESTLNIKKLFNYHSFIAPESKIFGTSWLGSFKKFAETMKSLGITPLTGLSYLFARKDFYLSLTDSYKINIESPNQLYSDKAIDIIKQNMEYENNVVGASYIYNKDNNIAINTIEAILNSLYTDGLSGIEKRMKLANVGIVENILEWIDATAEAYPENCQVPSVMLKNKKLSIWFKDALQRIDNNDTIEDKESAKLYLANIVKVQQVGLSKGLPTLSAMAVPEIRQSMYEAKQQVRSELLEIAQASLEDSTYYFSELHYIGSMKGSLQLEEPIYGSIKTNGQVARDKNSAHDIDCLYSTVSLFEYTQTIGMELLFIIGQLLDEALDLYPDTMTLSSIGISPQETLAGGLLNLEYIVANTYAEPVKTTTQEYRELRNGEISAIADRNKVTYQNLNKTVNKLSLENDALIDSMKEQYKYMLTD